MTKDFADYSHLIEESETPKRSFSLWGVIIAGVLFLAMLGNLMAMLVGEAPAMAAAMILTIGTPAVALLIRSLRMPMGLVRGTAVVLGGILAGSQLGLAMASAPGPSNAAALLVILAIGGTLLWYGFTTPRRKR